MTPPNITKGEWKFSTTPQPNGCPIIGANGLMVCMLAHSVNEPKQKEEALANATFLTASKKMAEALLIVCACGEPEKASFYDEEGVEGWKWTHPDGREWTCIGDWDEPAPMHPVAHAALLQAGYTE